MNTLLARSPLHAWQEANGARFTQRHGWRLAESFHSGASQRSELMLADVTPFAKLSITGNDVSGQAGAVLPDAQPGNVAVVEGAGWLCYLSEDQLLFLSSRLDARLDDFQLPRQPHDARPATWDVTSAYAGFLLIGEQAARLAGSSLNLGGGPATLAPGSCVETGFFGVNCLLALLDERPVLGIWVPWDAAEYAWERLCEAAPHAPLLGVDALRKFGWHA